MTKRALHIHCDLEIKYNKSITFLSDSSMYFLGNAPYEDVFTFVADKLSDLTGTGIVVSEFSPQLNATIVRSVKLDKHSEKKIVRLLGSKLVGLTFKVDSETRKKFIPGKLTIVEGGIYELSFYRIPQRIAKIIEKILNIQIIYAMAFVIEEDFLGTVVLTAQKQIKPSDLQIVEAFVNQAAMALKRKKTEQKLMETKHLLEKEKQRLELMEKKKDEFIGIASHELKTPLTSVKAFAQLLEKHIQQPKEIDTEKIMYFITNLNRELNRMQDLIIDMLNVNKIEAGNLALNKEKVNLNQLLTDIITYFVYTIDARKITQEGKTKDLIQCDKNKIEQVMLNLLSNANKYSPPSTDIIVRVIEKKKEVIVSVTDFGKGIPEAHKEKIFDRYHRVDEKKQQGFGLGLYIASEIIRRHKGRMWFESAIGKGSTFSFSLPK